MCCSVCVKTKQGKPFSLNTFNPWPLFTFQFFLGLHLSKIRVISFLTFLRMIQQRLFIRQELNWDFRNFRLSDYGRRSSDSWIFTRLSSLENKNGKQRATIDNLKVSAFFYSHSSQYRGKIYQPCLAPALGRWKEAWHKII